MKEWSQSKLEVKGQYNSITRKCQTYLIV